MLTRSSIFEELAEREGIQTETIVKITIDSTEYLFSYRPMPRGLNSNPIYPVLQSCGDIEESIDIYSKRLSYDSVSITLSDIPFYPNTGDLPKRASALLTEINGAAVDIYFMIGDGITDIADCLHIFSGYVFTAPKLTHDLFTIEAENKIKAEDVIIPSRVIQDEVSTAPTEFKNIPIPLVYGYFHLGTQKEWLVDYVLEYPGTGLVKGFPISNARYSFYIIADHVITSDAAFFNLQGPTVIYISYIQQSYTAENSRLLIRPDSIANVCMLIFPVDADLPGIYDDESYQADNAANAETYAYGQYATMPDNESDNTLNMYGLSLWSLAHPELFAQHISNCNLIKAFYTSIVAKAGVTITHMLAYLYYGREEGADERLLIGDADSSISYVPGQHEIDNGGKSGKDVTSGLLQEYVAALQVASIGQNEGDSVLDNQDMLDINKFHISLYWTLTERPNEIWCTCKGQRFAAWIETAGRDNPGGFASGRVIEHPIYIIESLYRIQLGLGDDDIDTASFDNAYEEVLEGRINILEQKPMSDYIRQLAEQSTFAICHSSTGKVRAVKLNDASPETAATIERHHLIDDQMTVIKSSRIINSLTVQSNWHAEYAKFFDRDTYEDSDSIDTHRTRSAEYKWENISGDAAEHVASAYVNSTDGLWSKEHIQATFSTFGLIHSHLEVGDWISISTDLDELRTPFGGTWYGKSLLITKISKSEENHCH